ncbi:hypothetical protein [Algoriphagus limi]|uniref:Sulfotransferase family protein n=1 Tax=Algoriphagus limi TaxID=2975273 RepID=A0ABT2G1P8_9BACT|nr:hypothetical protein [Algoriphagus limi]MCS5489200.1 hypothetical protein [Algoriphagus limi]
MSYKKNELLEYALKEINSLLKPVEIEQISKVGKPKFPNLFLIGGPRCGSTFFTQWAADLDIFSYPSNFLSRLYEAPYLGALIYNIVTKPEYQYRDEFADVNVDFKLNSSIGKTSGFKAPHEFWYFWRRFMNFPEVPFSESEFEDQFDFDTFQKELALIQKAFDDKPFLFKAKIANWYLKPLNENIDDAIFLHLHRDPIPMTRSLLKAREKWVGSREKWFSWKPREYNLLKDLDVYHQVAGQIYFLEKEILTNRKCLGSKYLSFSYEEFCENPERIYFMITSKIQEFSPDFSIPDYKGDKEFSPSNPISEDDKHIKKAFEFFENKYGELVY